MNSDQKTCTSVCFVILSKSVSLSELIISSSVQLGQPGYYISLVKEMNTCKWFLIRLSGKILPLVILWVPKLLKSWISTGVAGDQFLPAHEELKWEYSQPEDSSLKGPRQRNMMTSHVHPDPPSSICPWTLEHEPTLFLYLLNKNKAWATYCSTYCSASYTDVRC